MVLNTEYNMLHLLNKEANNIHVCFNIHEITLERKYTKLVMLVIYREGNWC